MAENKLIVGNWKMNSTLADAYLLANGARAMAEHLEHTEIVLCPPSPWLGLLAEHCVPRSTYPHLKLGAQNMHYLADGAYTGEISPLMVREVAEYVLIGHSERVRVFKESVEFIAAKVQAALQYGITPIVCVGEEKKEADSIRQVVHRLSHLLKEVEEEQLGKVVVAYEPVWAIGTGQPATAEYAQEMVSTLRNSVVPHSRILYGGSVDDKLAPAYLGQPDIDGLLVGGASLKLRTFLAIAQHADDQVISQRTAQSPYATVPTT